MKYTFFLFLLALGFVGHSQTPYEIKLSKTLNEDRMGVWEKGDYKVYVDLGVVATSFRTSCRSNADAILYYTIKDSATANFYNQTSKRYQVAAEQIEKANHGFDLRSLIVYSGVENEKENTGNSKVVERVIKQLVQNGTAVVFYKGKRVFTLKNRYESKGEEILDYGYEIRMYFDDAENFLFKDYQHLGW